MGGVFGAESGAKRFEDGGGLGLVESRPGHVCLRWPLMVASEEGQCFIVLRRLQNIVACFDGCKPGGRDWVTSGGMVETDKSADDGEVVCAGGLGG